LNRRQLIEELGLRLGGVEEAEAALSAIVDIVVDQVAAGGKVAVAGFGTFEPATRSSRVGRNPRTGALARVSRARVPRFRAEGRFRNVVADPRLLRDPTGARGLQATRPTRDTFLLTNNPRKWELDADELADWVVATAGGHLVEGRWSTGATTKKISPGDRAFLLRQGVARRGLFASGTIESHVYQAEHWDGGGGLANYADVLWDTVLDPEDALSIETLFHELPEGQWEPQASGSQVESASARRLEDLWIHHVAAVRAARPASTTAATGGGQGRRLDAKLRKEIEDLAQARLTRLYEDEGWKVEDLRYGNPFDAKATKGNDTLYLEAKGTVTDGERVIVTRGEVAWARSHPAACIMGVLSGLTLQQDGSIDPTSGTMRRYSWEAEEDDLRPLDYDFYPRASAAVGES
jgi:nucleoid DNA-binding protein